MGPQSPFSLQEAREPELDEDTIKRIVNLKDIPELDRSVKELLTEEHLFEAGLTHVDPSDYYPLHKSRKGKKKMDSMKARKEANAKAEARKRAAQKRTAKSSPPRKEGQVPPPSPQKKPKRADLPKNKSESSFPPPPPPTAVEAETSRGPQVVEGSYLGINRVRADLVSSLKGSRPKIYRDFVSSSHLTPVGLMRLPDRTKVAMDVPAKTWTPRHERFCEDMPVDDMVATGMAHLGQALNYFTRTQARMSEVASDKNKFKKLATEAKTMYENEVKAKNEAEEKLRDALAEVNKLQDVNRQLKSSNEEEVKALKEEVSGLKEEVDDLKKSKGELLKDLEVSNRIEADLKREKAELEAAAQLSYKESVKKFKDSVEYEHDVDETYYLTFKEIVEDLESKRPEVDITFLKEKLEVVYKKYQELMPTGVDDEDMDLLSPTPEIRPADTDETVNVVD